MSFQVIKTFKLSNDPEFEAKKNRILELYTIADGKAKPGKDDPTVIFCMDGRSAQPAAASRASNGRSPRRARATSRHHDGVVVGRPTPARTESGI